MSRFSLRNIALKNYLFVLFNSSSIKGIQNSDKKLEINGGKNFQALVYLSNGQSLLEILK